MEFKEIEREKRVKDAQRNLRLAECKVEAYENAIKEIMQKEDIQDVHVAARLSKTRINCGRAYSDLKEAQELLDSAEADYTVIKEAVEKMGWL